MSTHVSSTQSTTSTHSTTGTNFWESFQSGTGGAAVLSTLTPEININTVRKTVEESFQVITAKSASLLSLSKVKALDACVEMRQLLNFVFQNLELKGEKLSGILRQPFKMIKDTSQLEKCPGMCPAPERSRTNFSRE